MGWRLNIILLTAWALGACTLYKSNGREAIEKNEGAIVSIFAEGFYPPAPSESTEKNLDKANASFAFSLIDSDETQYQYYYLCRSSKATPDLLKQPLFVIETPFESKNFSVLLKSDSSRTERERSIIVYKFAEPQNMHLLCTITFLKQQPLLRKEIVRAARVGVDLIQSKSENF